MHPEVLNLYNRIDWTKQVIVFANVVNYFMQHISTSPDHKKWAFHASSTYVCPNTLHRLRRYANQTAEGANLDNIITFTVDVDYKNTEKRYFGNIYIDLLDAGLPPSMIVDTPHGFHCWYFLESPLVMRWQQSEAGCWQLRKEAEKALSWYRSISNALIHRFIALGLPADRIANSPARLFRNPTNTNILHLDANQKYTMHQLSDQLESWALDRSISVPAFRRILTNHFDGAMEGQRNQVGFKVALALASEYGEAGLIHFLSWADRCSPKYRHSEAEAVWRCVYKKWAAGEISYVRRESVRTRQQQGPYARKMYSAKVDEKIAAAIIRMQAAGCPDDPWNHTRALAREAGITHATIITKKREILKK